MRVLGLQMSVCEERDRGSVCVMSVIDEIDQIDEIGEKIRLMRQERLGNKIPKNLEKRTKAPKYL